LFFVIIFCFLYHLAPTLPQPLPNLPAPPAHPEPCLIAAIY
jgi:hypothetical protein